MNKAINGSNILYIGAKDGFEQNINDISREKIVFYNGSIIDSIRIGEKKYGGDGGSPEHYIWVPESGVMYIREIWTSTIHDDTQLISYIDISAEGVADHPDQHILVGKQHEDGTQLVIEQNIKIVGISASSKGVDSLALEIVNM